MKVPRIIDDPAPENQRHRNGVLYGGAGVMKFFDGAVLIRC